MLNFVASVVGSLRFEILDAQGHPVPGFSSLESLLVWEDKIQYPIRLGAGVGKLQGSYPNRLEKLL